MKINYTETDKVKLIVKVPNLTPENAAIIARAILFALENDAKLKLLDEFSAERRVEYAEVKSA